MASCSSSVLLSLTIESAHFAPKVIEHIELKSKGFNPLPSIKILKSFSYFQSIDLVKIILSTASFGDSWKLIDLISRTYFTLFAFNFFASY